MFPNLGPMEMAIIMIVAVLLFGKRLPEVGRNLGKGIIEFKKGLRGLEDEFDGSKPAASSRSEPYRPREEPVASVPKFEPPSAPPVAEPVAAEAQHYQD
jgi:sec-independent protein translocase protein TatA